MALPDISVLTIHDIDPGPNSEGAPDRSLEKYREYVLSIPYGVEPESKMVEMLDFIVLRLTQCTIARDYEVCNIFTNFVLVATFLSGALTPLHSRVVKSPSRPIPLHHVNFSNFA